jgi:hypothetical protein
MGIECPYIIVLISYDFARDLALYVLQCFKEYPIALQYQDQGPVVVATTVFSVVGQFCMCVTTQRGSKFRSWRCFETFQSSTRRDNFSINNLSTVHQASSNPRYLPTNVRSTTMRKSRLTGSYLFYTFSRARNAQKNLGRLDSVC